MTEPLPRPADVQQLIDVITEAGSYSATSIEYLPEIFQQGCEIHSEELELGLLPSTSGIQAFNNAVVDKQAHLKWSRQASLRFLEPGNPSEANLLTDVVAGRTRIAPDQYAMALSPAELTDVSRTPKYSERFSWPKPPRRSKSYSLFDQSTMCELTVVATDDGWRAIDPFYGSFMTDAFEQVLAITSAYSVVEKQGRVYAFGTLDRPLANADLMNADGARIEQATRPIEHHIAYEATSAKWRYDKSKPSGNGADKKRKLHLARSFISDTIEGDYIAEYDIGPQRYESGTVNETAPGSVEVIEVSSAPEIDFFSTSRRSQEEQHPNLVQGRDVYVNVMRSVVGYAIEHDPALRAALSIDDAYAHDLPAVKGDDGIIRQLHIELTGLGNTMLMLEALDEGGSFVPEDGMAIVRGEGQSLIWAANPELDAIPVTDERMKKLLDQAGVEMQAYVDKLTEAAKYGTTTFDAGLPEIAASLKNRPDDTYRQPRLVGVDTSSAPSQRSENQKPKPATVRQREALQEARRKATRSNGPARFRP